MENYRKRPVVIQAVQFTRPEGETAAIGTLFHSWQILYDSVSESFYLEIHTLEGVMRADENDWIIRGVNGEHYPCKPDVFEKTYDKVEEVSLPVKSVDERPKCACGKTKDHDGFCDGSHETNDQEEAPVVSTPEEVVETAEKAGVSAEQVAEAEVEDTTAETPQEPEARVEANEPTS